MSQGITSYRDLIVWQKALELARLVYEITRRFPREELYGLTSQMKRAALSVPANIAEGAARTGPREFAHHISIARGSLAELETLSELAHSFGYEFDLGAVVHGIDEIERMLEALRQSLFRRNP